MSQPVFAGIGLTIGTLIAIAVLVVAIVLIVAHTFTWPLGLIAALAVARIVP